MKIVLDVKRNQLASIRRLLKADQSPMGGIEARDEKTQKDLLLIIVAATEKLRPNRPEGICRRCDCTEQSACAEGCSWVLPDLCSACLTPAERKELKRFL